MSSQKSIITFGETTLYHSNVATLEPKTWLDDQIINFFFDYLELEKFPQQKDLFAFCGPTVVWGWRSSSYEQSILESIFFSPLNLKDKELIFMIINNNNNPHQAFGGSHWSLLVYRRSSKEFEHYDSAGNTNFSSAVKAALLLGPFLGKAWKSAADVDIKRVQVPQQTNSCDCGVYACAYTEFVANAFVENIEFKEIEKAITPVALFVFDKILKDF